MHYRTEIDGLRAVAVIPVILFHAGFTIFRGGYIGVDIFFVISGYLITNIIISELELGKFSILRFYERRARRILPALFFVMIVCIPFAWTWMFPSQFKSFSQSLVAVPLFASNILFWQKSGYFAAASEENPLLHTWSLAVEEQYYMFLPIFLILLWRFGRSPVFYSIIAISIISLILSEWGWRNQPTANFYLAPTRAWELLAGSICAFLQFGKTQKSNNTLSVIGLTLILFAIFVYDENTPFPSMYALAPVVGTALIIMYGGRESWVARLLSMRGFVGIGLISYSAYLWHQPLFAFARIRSSNAPEPWLMLLLVIASLVLAYFSWRYVESPFRKRTAPALQSQRAIFGAASVVSLAFIVFGLYGHSSGGYEKYLSFKSNIETFGFTTEELVARGMVSGRYPKPDNSTIDSQTNLLRFEGTSDKIVYVMGDSHTLQYLNAIDTYYKLNGSSVKNDTLINSGAQFPPDAASFPEIFDSRVETVIISYFWALKFGSTDVNQSVRCCGNGSEGRIGEIAVRYRNQEEMDVFELKIDKFVKNLLASGKNVAFILDNPFGEELDPTNFITFAGRNLMDFSPPVGASRDLFDLRRKDVNKRLLRISLENGIGYIDPFDFLCSDSWCPAITPDNHFIYKDYDHYSPYASKNLIKFIDRFIN